MTSSVSAESIAREDEIGLDSLDSCAILLSRFVLQAYINKLTRN